MRKVSSAEAINNIDNLLLYMQQEELNMELQSLTKLRKSVLGNIMQKKGKQGFTITLVLHKNLCTVYAIINNIIIK